MKIIAISGHAQNGKDTVAGMIEKKLAVNGYSVLITHYADLLKYICEKFFHWNGEKDEHGRTLLQFVGTEIIRKQEPDFWVEFISHILKLFHDNWDYVLIPDARFPNEIERLKRDGFKVIHLSVSRPDYKNTLTMEQRNHSSETALDNTKPDYLILNYGSIDDLNNIVVRWVEDVLYIG